MVSGDFVALSSDNKVVGNASRTGIRFHELVTGKLVKEFDFEHAKSIAFSPDDKLIAFTYLKTIQIVDYNSGSVIMKHEDNDQCYSIVFSPTNKEIAFYSGKL